MRVLVLFGLVALLHVCFARLPSEEDLIRKARQETVEHFEQVEMKYHKELQQKQEELVNSLRKSYRVGKPMQTNPNDLAALQALYKSTNGSKWTNNTGWMKGDPCTEPYWYGLYCINGRVLQINLVYNGLAGPIPADLAKADALQVVRFYSNLITGEIPAEIFSMQSLQILDVNTNIVTGGLPSQISMKSLQSLITYGNQMTGKFPTSFDTPQLQVLELSSNQFTGPLPDSLGNCKSLQELTVSRNLLTGDLPKSYGNLENLQQLWTFNNNFHNPTIPDSWEGMTSLQNVQADGFTGPFPSWMGQKWSKLQYLVIVDGNLTGNFPSSLCDCQDMIEMRLFKNLLGGEIPQCMCNMRALQDIGLSDNSFTGPLPDCLGDITGLQNFAVSRNNLSGPFPASVGYLKNLTVFDISSNRFYGSIPNTIDNLRLIAEFAICYNKFSSIESGVDNFFNRIKNYGCLFYSNPWSCPLEVTVPKACQAECSDCNSGDKHSSCSSCITDTACGWCNEGKNCLEGSAQGPYQIYRCGREDWTSGASATCP